MSQPPLSNADLRARFIGMWRLVSSKRNGEVHPDRGANATAFIVYHESGHMAVQVMPGHARAKFAADEPTYRPHSPSGILPKSLTRAPCVT